MFHPLFCFKVALLGITRNNINVAEDVGHAPVCVAVETSSMECPLDYPFDVQVRTIDYSAGMNVGLFGAFDVVVLGIWIDKYGCGSLINSSTMLKLATWEYHIGSAS